MSKIAIVTDSAVSLPEELVRRHNIQFLPLWIHRGKEAFLDGIEVTSQEVYSWLREGHRLTTSQPSIGQCLEVFSELRQRAEAIVSILAAAELSGTYSSALNAAKLLEGFPIRVIDSRTLSSPQGFIVLAAARAAQAGATLTEVVEAAKNLIPRVNLLVVLETLEYLHRGGRVPAIAALAGSLLKISPIVEVKDGQAGIFATVRTKKKALERLLEEAKRRTGESLVHGAIIHADVIEEAERLKERVVSLFNLAELYVTEFPPVLGVHTGPGALGLAFCKEE